MRHTPYLLQRLQKPYGNNILGLEGNPFSFGGGLPRGGLSKEFFQLLSQIWSYDYMGSAEFEFGALPTSWKAIYNNHKDYVTGSVEVTATRVNYDKGRRATQKGKHTVYYFCHKEDEADVKEWIAKFADDAKHDFHTKEYVGLGDALLNPDKARTQGWHDIDNHYLFFSDKGMYDKFIEVLEIE